MLREDWRGKEKGSCKDDDEDDDDDDDDEDETMATEEEVADKGAE
jgi:hypothetical protein